MAFLRKLLRSVPVILSILAAMYGSNLYSSNCPHPTFIDRHICTTCHTLEDAADFSRYRQNPTYTNTVVFGYPSFEVKTYKEDRCGNVDFAKVAVCRIVGGLDDMYYNRPVYTCTWKGQTCFTEHSITSGHLFYGEIKCFD